jgi:predicted Kef-type K+ transport protein
MHSCILASASDTDWAIITDLVVILVNASIVAIVMQPMRLAAIPAYLIAGALVGPRTPGFKAPRKAPGKIRPFCASDAIFLQP